MKNNSDAHPPWFARLLYGSTNVALFVAGVANLIAGTWAAFDGSATIAATSLTAGLVLLFAATIDRFESLKGLGIEAKTRQLDQKIDQADEALRRVREIGEMAGAALIELKSQVGRMGVVPGVRESIDSADKVRAILRRLGSSEETIAATLEPWARTLCFDVALKMSTTLRQLVQTQLDPLLHRRGILAMANPPDPGLAALSGEIQKTTDFLQRLRVLHRLQLEEFPECLTALIEDAPLLDESVRASLRQQSAQFIPGMRSLRTSRTLSEIDLWTQMIDREADRQ